MKHEILATIHISRILAKVATLDNGLLQYKDSLSSSGQSISAFVTGKDIQEIVKSLYNLGIAVDTKPLQ